MSIDTKHYSYNHFMAKWELCRDSLDGSDAIKDKGPDYLPYTPGQVVDGAANNPQSAGGLAYLNYKTRAVYPEDFSATVEATLGTMHKKPAIIEVPAIMSSMLENATLLGESLHDVLRKINYLQLKTGRLGLLADIQPTTTGDQPLIVFYEDKTIINWDDTASDGESTDLDYVVLDESGHTRDGFDWVFENKYRLCALVSDSENAGYMTNVFEKSAEITPDTLSEIDMVAPSVKGIVSKKVPFVFINACDIAPTPSNPPLLGVARAALDIYKGEADYRFNLFMQGQDTFVTIGASGSDDEEVRTGAGAHLSLPVNGDAKYVGVSSQGLPEQRQALAADYNRLAIKSGQLVNQDQGGAESGEALRIRRSAQTATLPQIAEAGAAGLEKLLKIIAEWLGASPDEVSVQPNLEFADAALNGQTLLQFGQAKAMGVPYSDESIHEYMQDNGYTNVSYEEELSRLESEAPTPGAAVANVLGDE